MSASRARMRLPSPDAQHWDPSSSRRATTSPEPRDHRQERSAADGRGSVPGVSPGSSVPSAAAHGSSGKKCKCGHRRRRYKTSQDMLRHGLPCTATLSIVRISVRSTIDMGSESGSQFGISSRDCVSCLGSSRVRAAGSHGSVRLTSLNAIVTAAQGGGAASAT